jgi:hypothetical protein
MDIAALASFEAIGSIRSVVGTLPRPVHPKSAAMDHVEYFRKAERERRLACVSYNEKREENSNE